MNCEREGYHLSKNFKAARRRVIFGLGALAGGLVAEELMYRTGMFQLLKPFPEIGSTAVISECDKADCTTGVTGDLHIHTKDTPSILGETTYSLEEALETAAEKGLGIVAITEQDFYHDYDKSQKLAERAGVILIPAVETYGIIKEGWRAQLTGLVFGRKKAIADILAYGVTEPISEKRLPISEVVRRIHVQGGLAVVAHPSVAEGLNWYDPLGSKLIKELGIDGIEVLNGKAFQFMNRAAQRLAVEHNLPVTGGSDARSLDRIGKGFTVFSSKLTIDDWQGCLDAIKQNGTSVGGTGRKLGPFFG